MNTSIVKTIFLATATMGAAFVTSNAEVSADTHRVVKGDTVYDIALANNSSVSEIVRINDLPSNGHWIYVGNDLKVNEESQTKTSDTENNHDTAFVAIDKRNENIKNANNSYPFGQCTWYVKASLGWVGNYWGNAQDWAKSAQTEGYQVNGEAKPGSVAVFSPGLHGADATYGHVAVVEHVNSDGTILISEGNAGRGLYSTRTVPTASVQFIHQN
ncbi:COG3942 and LysM peptidoglycan-binding domain-containing protein [Leuconostoc pseudomesenteroides]|uniref:COG3942 and LysM peptidoglycan-binding domain-containing protein n=1 Tax=Leuconostoc pseudomesenteroides TaxID=33968 RepID=UPI0039EA7034